jgi:Tfp pilus assembly PilM family ATPase
VLNPNKLKTLFINLFYNRYPETKIERIVVTGAASTLPDFPLYIGNKLGLTIEIGNAWRNVQFPTNRMNELQSVSNIFAVATGLAERNETEIV